MKTIPLTRGAFALIDDEDFALINSYTWHLSKAGYATTNSKPMVYMHRLVNRTPPDVDTDHINGNTIDNRRSNLRDCTVSQNLMNRRAQRNNKTGLKGVSWLRMRPNLSRRYFAQIKAGGVKRFLGYFHTAEEAHLAYVAAAKHLHGAFLKI